MPYGFNALRRNSFQKFDFFTQKNKICVHHKCSICIRPIPEQTKINLTGPLITIYRFTPFLDKHCCSYMFDVNDQLVINCNTAADHV